MSDYQDAVAQGKLRASPLGGDSQAAQVNFQDLTTEKFQVRTAITTLGKQFFLGPVAQQLKVIADDAVKKANEDLAAANKATAEAKATQAKADAAQAAADKAAADAKVAAALAEKAQSDLQALKAISEKAKTEAAAAQTAAAAAVATAKAKQLAAQAASQIASTAQKKLSSLKSKIGQNNGIQTTTPITSGASPTNTDEFRDDTQHNLEGVNSGSRTVQSSHLPIILIALTMICIAVVILIFSLRRRQGAKEAIYTTSDLDATRELDRIRSQLKKSPSLKSVRKAAPRKTTAKKAAVGKAQRKKSIAKKAVVRKTASKKVAPKKR